MFDASPATRIFGGYILHKFSTEERPCMGLDNKKGVPSAESSHTRWDLGKGIFRQPYPCKIPLKFCKEAGSNSGPPGHKWRVSTTAPGPPFSLPPA
uniref:Uncharacterized protein n=1 Tax=Arundo donax TaxID=35708 RepID=A0A0A9ECA3_ARUDO